jgi:uncharacterized DUF497 family protein
MGMRCLLSVLGLAGALVAAPAAFADQQTFIITSNADGYGVDRCLATGATCGTTVATAYCRAHEYQQAISFRKVEREEITGTVKGSPSACKDGNCENLVAIECTR